jgi:hypothetical protein
MSQEQSNPDIVIHTPWGIYELSIPDNLDAEEVAKGIIKAMTKTEQEPERENEGVS